MGGVLRLFANVTEGACVEVYNFLELGGFGGQEVVLEEALEGPLLGGSGAEIFGH